MASANVKMPVFRPQTNVQNVKMSYVIAITCYIRLGQDVGKLCSMFQRRQSGLKTGRSLRRSGFTNFFRTFLVI